MSQIMEQGREGIPSLPCWCVIIYAYNPVSFHLFRGQNQGQKLPQGLKTRLNQGFSDKGVRSPKPRAVGRVDERRKKRSEQAESGCRGRNSLGEREDKRISGTANG